MHKQSLTPTEGRNLRDTIGELRRQRLVHSMDDELGEVRHVVLFREHEERAQHRRRVLDRLSKGECVEVLKEGEYNWIGLGQVQLGVAEPGERERGKRRDGGGCG